MLTVQTLVRELDLKLASGEGRADLPVRWVHITELPDPTPWLSGGELLLTTGIQLGTAKEQRAFIRRLVKHGLAGLGFGTGFDHKSLPKALVSEADELGFPVFEVPYRMPFIAVTELAFTQIVNEQYEVLRRGLDIHKRLERMVLEERGLDGIVDLLASSIRGQVVVLDRRGRVVAGRPREPLSAAVLEAVGAEVAERTQEHRHDAFVPDPAGGATAMLALPISGPVDGGLEAWLVAARAGAGLGDFERLILQQAVVVVALELMRRRVVTETERRLAGDVLESALSGRLERQELLGRLEPFGLGDRAAVLLFQLDDPAAATSALAEVLSEEGRPALIAARDAHLCAIVDATGLADDGPVEIAGRARQALGADHGEPRAAASRPADIAGLGRSFHEARCALEATSLANGGAPAVASYRDLGAFHLLLAVQDDEALRLYCDNVLAPLATGENEYGDELLRSLEAYIEQNGHWERAARQLYCHRHTLRYRIRRVEELTGRDLSRASDRIELWLALRARELLP